MIDMERVRLLRDTAPWPSAASLAHGRARLLTAAAREHPRPEDAAPTATARRTPGHRYPRGLRSGWPPVRLRPVLAIATAAAVAAGITGYALSSRKAPAPARVAIAVRPATSHPQAGSAVKQARLAAKVLRDAAAHVALKGVTTEPSPGQWIYSKTVDSQPTSHQVNENWITFDGSQSAYFTGRQLTVHGSPMTPPGPGVSPWTAWNAEITPKTAYDVLASLPTDPKALLAVIARQAAGQNAQNIAAGNPVSGTAAKTAAQREFDYLTLILWNAAGGVGGPPAAAAAAYRALATLGGISVQQGITDAAGNPAIGISADGGYSQLLIDPVSYQVTGLRQVATGIAPKPDPVSAAASHKPPQPVPAKGTVLESLAYAQVAEVTGPGVR